MNRKILVIAIVIVVALVCLTSAGFGISWWFKNQQPTAQGRALVSKLAYCNSNNETPCIVSFSVDANGTMLANILTPASSYPDFYLTISNNVIENRYECQHVQGFPVNIYCTGAEMYPGEPLQFNLVAIEDDAILAEGSFAIIGLLLPNPAEAATEAPAPTEPPAVTEPPTETPTPFLIEIFTPLPNDVTDTPSYPNPTSYP